MATKAVSKIKKPGAFQVRILKVLAEHGECKAHDVYRLVEKCSSIDQCDRALEGLFRMRFVDDHYDGYMPRYTLSEKGKTWLEESG